MGLFNGWRKEAAAEQPEPAPSRAVPISHIDLSKRYDVYCTDQCHDRLYENIRFLGIRTFERISEFTSGAFGYLELEAADGTTILIPTFGIQMICEHGKEPPYKVLRRRHGPRQG